MFIETCDGDLINTDHVVKIVRHMTQKGWGDASCETVEGEWIKVPHSTTEELVAAQSLIPAQPGFTLLAFYPSDGTEFIERSPVIAWRVDAEMGFHRAIGLYQPSDNATRTGILCPNGRVIDPGNDFQDSEQNWLECARKEAADHLARQKEKAAKAKEQAA